jgi:hypothetical protein
MDKFIHRQNLILFMRRLDDPDLPQAQREAILRLLSEEQGKGYQLMQTMEGVLDACQRAQAAPPLLAICAGGAASSSTASGDPPSKQEA